MLIQSIFTFTTPEKVALPRTYRTELIKQLHQRMSLDFNTDIPSVTFSGILGRSITSGDFITFLPDEVYQFTLSGLQDVAFTAISSLDLASQLDFLGVNFRIIDREDYRTSYEILYQTLVANEPEPVRRFELKFLTPTAFAQGRTHLPLPVPTLMLRSWLERWNHFAPVYLGGDELIQYLGDAIALSRHRIQSQIFPIHTGWMTGFMGDVTLQVISKIDPLVANVAHLLIAYSEFSGTGMKTRLGMGNTEFKDQP